MNIENSHLQATGTRPFNLAEAIQGKRIVRRDGEPVHFFGFNSSLALHSCVAVVYQNQVMWYREDGRRNLRIDSDADLFMC